MIYNFILKYMGNVNGEGVCYECQKLLNDTRQQPRNEQIFQQRDKKASQRKHPIFTNNNSQVSPKNFSKLIKQTHNKQEVKTLPKVEALPFKKNNSKNYQLQNSKKTRDESLHGQNISKNLMEQNKLKPSNIIPKYNITCFKINSPPKNVDPNSAINIEYPQNSESEYYHQDNVEKNQQFYYIAQSPSFSQKNLNPESPLKKGQKVGKQDSRSIKINQIEKNQKQTHGEEEQQKFKDQRLINTNQFHEQRLLKTKQQKIPSNISDESNFLDIRHVSLLKTNNAA